MPALQVRDFPQELYDELRECAARNHRSIAQQTIACVENEIRRSKAVESEATEDPTGASVPSAVHESAMRARGVDPFGWAGVFQVETDKDREARHARWEELRKLFSEIAERWEGQVPTCDEVAQMVADQRDERTERTMMNVEKFLASEGRG